MKRVKITNYIKNEKFQADFEDPTAWIAQEVANNSWGFPDRWIPDSPMSLLSDEEKAKAQESRKVIVKEAKPESIVQVQKELEDGSVVTEDVVTPAQEEESYMEYFFPAEYTIEIEDITEQLEQEKTNAEALKYLAETDWMILRSIENPSKPVPKEVKDKRQEARDKVKR